MRGRKLVALAVVGAVGGVVARRRHGASAAAGRADVWFDDGSMVSVPGTSPAGSRLVALAEDVLRSTG
jgi:hypothetical protein